MVLYRSSSTCEEIGGMDSETSTLHGQGTMATRSPAATGSSTIGSRCDLQNEEQPSATATSQSQTTTSTKATSDLPAGCAYGPILYVSDRAVSSSPVQTPPSLVTTISRTLSRSPSRLDGPEPTQIIWVDFPPSSRANPFFFSRRRKWGIMTVALLYAFITSLQTSAFSIGFDSMQRDLGMSNLEAAAGVSLYGWGFAIGPLALAPLTEEFGRSKIIIGSVAAFTLLHLMMTLAKNVATVLVGRFLMGIGGCIGATVVAGTVSDIYMPQHRGFPMALFTVCVVAAPGLGPVLFCWVEANPALQWRWIHWITMMMTAANLVVLVPVLRETRATVLLRRMASRLRKHRGMLDGGRYTSRAEVDKPKFWPSMRQSLSRPILFLIFEPVVTFFAIWASLAWGVFFIQIAGLQYVFRTIYGFGVTSVGLTYLSIAIGAIIGFAANFGQDALYRRHVKKHGVEARLFAPMAAGVLFPIGCIIFGLTSIPSVTFIAPCIGIAIILVAAYTIYQCCFVYLAECYGSQASSAVAGMSFLRIMVGSAFPMFTEQLFERLTPRWGLFLLGCIAILLAPIPYIAFYRGPWIRARSPYSKLLMEEERRRIEIEGSGSGERAVELEVEKDLEAAAVAKYGGGSRPGAEPHTTGETARRTRETGQAAARE